MIQDSIKDITKNLVIDKKNELNFAFGGSNKVFTPAEKCTQNELINLSQLIELIKSDAPSNALKIRKIVKNGFNQNIDAKKIKTQIKPLKNSLPFVLFSGFCSIHHNDKTLVYNGCLQLDIDFKFAGGDVKAIELKQVVKSLPYVVLAAISPSGYGLKCLIATDNFEFDYAQKISKKNYTSKHEKISKILISELAEKFDIDIKLFDFVGASQPCFVPYDKEVYFNPNHTTYNGFAALYKFEQQQRKEVEKQLLKAKQTTTQSRTAAKFDSDKITVPNIEILKYLTAQILAYKLDVTQNYKSWFGVACAYASCNSDNLFHKIASLNSTYDYDENKEIFAKASLNCSDSSIAYLVDTCKRSNITINDFCKNWIIENSPKKTTDSKGDEVKKTLTKLLNNETVTKIELIENYLKSKYDFRYNTVSNELQTKTKTAKKYEVLNENNLIAELLKIGLNNVNIPLLALLGSDEFRCKYDPINTYFNTLKKWDGNDYINDLASFVKAKNQDWFNYQFKKMMVRMVAGSVGRIKFNKQCFTLVGSKQNQGKSHFLRYLCPDDLSNHLQDNIDFSSKDGQISLATNFIINLDELDGIRQKDLSIVKNMLSKDVVKTRLPYARTETSLKRRANFVGSSNHSNLLSDETGNVRWLLFEIDTILHDNGGQNGYCKIDINKVYAQAVHLLKNGFEYQLTAEDLNTSEQFNKSFMVQSIEKDFITKYFAPSDSDNGYFYTTGELMAMIQEVEKSIKFSPRKFGSTLKELGFENTAKKRNGATSRGWFVDSDIFFQNR
jgi:predicted P-loop ATPase